MKIRFQADVSLNQNILSGVLRRVPEIDFQTAHDSRLHGVSDAQVLALAAHEGRILVTQDLRTMSGHFGQFVLKTDSPGVFIISQRISTHRAIEELILVWAASEAEEYINSIRNLFP